MPKTTLINMRVSKEFDVRIDRRSCVDGICLGNPFFMENEAERDAVCEEFAKFFSDRIERDPKYRAATLSLKGKVLGCWCFPKRCHGDTIIAWLEGQDK